MFRSVQEELCGQSTENSVDEILSYLREFRILLILDNLETIIDESLLRFFDELPIGSKVLTTSRIGLGEFERRLTLAPMKNSEASQLMRALSKTRGLTQLSELPQPKLNDFCHKLKNNPGFVKWFVSCVQAGKRPEQILQSTEIFLEFCLSNVYEYLSNDSRRLLMLMQAVSRPLSIPEFAFLIGLDPVRLQSSIHQLLQTNMLTMLASNDDGASDTRYSLSDLSRSYLTRKHPISTSDYTRFKKQEKELTEAQSEIHIASLEHSASVFKISIRNKSDAIIARYLIRALKLQQQGETEEALKFIDDAKNLSPGYYEVHRSEAWIHAQSGNIPAAKRAYEAALELEEKSAPLHIWYSGFVQRHEHDQALALKHLELAQKLDPDNRHALLEKSRLFLYSKDFSKAEEALRQIMQNQVGYSPRFRRMMWDLFMQIPSRKVEYLIRSQDYLGAVRAANQILANLDRVPRDMLDGKSSTRLRYDLQHVKGAARHLVDAQHQAEAEQVATAIDTELSFIGVESAYPWMPKDFGKVVRIKGYFGFVRINGTDKELYFQIASVRLEPGEEVLEGDEMEFSIGRNHEGECALDCRLIKYESD